MYEIYSDPAIVKILHNVCVDMLSVFHGMIAYKCMYVLCTRFHFRNNASYSVCTFMHMYMSTPIVGTPYLMGMDTWIRSQQQLK